MLKRLHVRDFKSLRDLEVEFGRLTVLVGANGCGKSSVLQAIKLVRDLALEGHHDVQFPSGALSRPRGANTPPSGIHIQLQCDADELRAELYPARDDSQTLSSKSSLTVLNPEDNLNINPFATFRVPDRVKKILEGVNLYQLDKRVMERPTYSEEADPIVGSQGENLATVLDAMQGFQRERFEEIEGQLRKLIPGLRQVRLQRVKVPLTRSMIVDSEIHQINDSVIGHQVLLDFEFARGVAADQASEGTLLLLGLLTVIGKEAGHQITVMLDDLDRALHPKAQRQLVEHLHTLLDQRPELQIIATSHSPYLVEHLAYDEVRAMTQSPTDGASLLERLDKHPDAERWRDEMSAGEFWSNVGEDWIHQAKTQ